VWNRVLAIFRAGFEAQWGRGAWPVAPLIMHGSIAAVLCGLARGELQPFGYALFALSVSMALIAIPLLGEFGVLLRSDPVADWIEAQPIRRVELRLGRTLVAMLLLAALVLSAMLPAALLAPSEMEWSVRLGLIAVGAIQAVVLLAAILCLQSVLGQRAEGLLVLCQTVLVAGVVIGIVAGLRYVPRLANLSTPSDASPYLALHPPAWFASLLFERARAAGAIWTWAGWIAGALSLAALAFAPLPRTQRSPRAGFGLALLLAPVRAAAGRWWVRANERASFHLVFDALPLERDFVLRTYPMLGIPLALIIAGARGSDSEERDALLAVLLFIPATYLPILLVHVPATSSPAARWILDTAPIPRAAIDNGAVKAVTLRFLLPLYALLSVVAIAQGGLDVVLRLALPAAVLAHILLRKLYPMCVEDLPLSVAPGDITAKLDWTGTLLMLGIGLTVLALIALKFVDSVGFGLACAVLLLGVEWMLDRAAGVDESAAV
jgi:hypothetical protein